MQVSKINVQKIIADALGSEPGYWAPGVTHLGWSFKLSDDGSEVIVNRALASDYVSRLCVGLRKVFGDLGMDVNVIGDDAF